MKIIIRQLLRCQQSHLHCSGSSLHCHPWGQSPQGPQTRQHRWDFHISKVVRLQRFNERLGGGVGRCYTGWRLWGVFNHLLMEHRHPPRGVPQACNRLAYESPACCQFAFEKILATCPTGEMTKSYRESAKSSASELKVSRSKYKIRSHSRAPASVPEVHYNPTFLPPALLRVVNYLLITDSASMLLLFKLQWEFHLLALVHLHLAKVGHLGLNITCQSCVLLCTSLRSFNVFQRFRVGPTGS